MSRPMSPADRPADGKATGLVQGTLHMLIL
jgi:hypothetical protein